MPRPTPRARLFLAAALLLPAAPALKADPQPYTPSSHLFSCLVPDGWRAFEERGGSLVHLIGPKSPPGDYRTGIDIEWMDPGKPGFRPYKDEIGRLRDGEPLEPVDSTVVQALRVSGSLARLFESSETRLLPLGGLPATATHLHHFVAFIPDAQGYFLVKLSSPRDVYLNYREPFLDFLRTFQILR